MYLSYSNNKKIIIPIVISLVLIVLQGFLPSIVLSDGLIITCDLFFIYLTWLALNKELYQIVIFAFFLGIFQDLVIQSDTVGLYAFIKVVSVYFINYLNKVRNLWGEISIVVYLFVIYFLHYFLYHFVFINELSIFMLTYILLEAVVNLIIFIICDKIFFN